MTTGLTSDMTENEFLLFRDLIHEECGLYFRDNRKSFLSNRIAKRITAKEMGSFYRYYNYLKTGGIDQERELLLLLDLLTINETSFFRNRPQFDLLEQMALPEILASKRPRTSLRVWSAGCSTGEEPYSIAISALETLGRHPEVELHILASDLSLSALETAERGFYSDSRLKDLAPRRKEKYFQGTEDGYRVRDLLRRSIVFDFHNLKHENGQRNHDIIFCRNVMIYFDQDEQKRVLNRLIDALRPGGYLFVGHAESVQGLTEELEFIHQDRGTAYRKVAA